MFAHRLDGISIGVALKADRVFDVLIHEKVETVASHLRSPKTGGKP